MIRVWMSAVLAALFVLVGCANQSFVGDWQAQPQPAGMRSATLRVSNDGTYGGVAVPDEGEPESTSGHWKKLSSDRAILTAADAPEKHPTLTMTAKDHLLYDDGSRSTTFVRQQALPTSQPVAR